MALSWLFVVVGDLWFWFQSKTKELKKQKKTQEKVNAEEYIAVA